MINVFEVQETNKMIEESNLDVRTITMGISLLDCCDNDVDVVCDKIYRKITEKAENSCKGRRTNRIGLRHSDCQ